MVLSCLATRKALRRCWRGSCGSHRRNDSKWEPSPEGWPNRTPLSALPAIGALSIARSLDRNSTCTWKPCIMTQTKQALPALTGLRFLAALYVVAFHFARPAEWNSRTPVWVTSILNCGYLGVGVFFVLSGFIL